MTNKMNDTFTYQGFVLRPLGEMTESALFNAMVNDYKGSFVTEDYSHSRFYESAEFHDASSTLYEIIEIGPHTMAFGTRTPKAEDLIIPCGGSIAIV